MIKRDRDGKIVEFDNSPIAPAPGASEAAVGPKDGLTFRAIDEGRLTFQAIDEEGHKRIAALRATRANAIKQARDEVTAALAGPTRERDQAIVSLRKKYDDEVSVLKNEEQIAIRTATAKIKGEFEAKAHAMKKRYEETRDAIGADLAAKIEAKSSVVVAVTVDAEIAYAQGLREIENWRTTAERQLREAEKAKAGSLSPEEKREEMKAAASASEFTNAPRMSAKR